MPNVELVRAFFRILEYVQVSSQFSCTQRHRQTHRHTDGHKYSVTANNPDH